jgi:hypothetical protein
MKRYEIYFEILPGMCRVASLGSLLGLEATHGRLPDCPLKATATSKDYSTFISTFFSDESQAAPAIS